MDWATWVHQVLSFKDKFVLESILPLHCAVSNVYVSNISKISITSTEGECIQNYILNQVGYERLSNGKRILFVP